MAEKTTVETVDPHVIVQQAADRRGQHVARDLPHCRRIAMFYEQPLQDDLVTQMEGLAVSATAAVSMPSIPPTAPTTSPQPAAFTTAIAYDDRMLLHYNGLDLGKYEEDGTIAEKSHCEQPARISAIWHTLLAQCSHHPNWSLLR